MTDHRMTEPLKPYEPEPAPSYDYDYDYDDRALKPKILWGRVAALGLGLLIAFFIGRMTAGGGDDAELVRSLRSDLREAEQANEDLQTQLDEAEAAVNAQPTVQPTTQPTAAETTEPTLEGEEYVVQKGDTLRLIAQDKCGDPEAADLLAEVNDIADPTLISVGMTLIIPSDCGS